MNILHLQTELNITCGVTKTIYLLSQKLDINYKQFILTLGGDGINRFDSSPSPVLNLNISRKSVSNTIRIFINLYIFCRKHKIDIVHSHHRYFDYLSYIISLILSVKTVCSVQSKVTGYSFFSYKSNILIAVSQSIKNHLRNNFNIDEKRISIVNNFIDPNEIKISLVKNELKTRLNISPSNFIIGFIGRISAKEKGIDLLLDAFYRFIQSNNNTFLLIVGKGPDEDFVKRYIEKYELKALIIPPQQSIYDYYNVCDLIILPSKIDPFPLTMLEAGIMKKPFIGSNIDGIAELIEENVDGLLFESGNVEDLKKKILELSIDREKGRMLGENLYKKVISDYTADQIIPKYKQIYNQLIDNN